MILANVVCETGFRSRRLQIHYFELVLNITKEVEARKVLTCDQAFIFLVWIKIQIRQQDLSCFFFLRQEKIIQNELCM